MKKPVPDMEENDRRPIVIATHQAFSSRYLLGTDIFQDLKAKGVPIVVLNPNADDPSFRNMFRDKTVTVEKFQYEKLFSITNSRLHRFFTKVRWLTLPSKHDITTVKVHQAVEIWNNRKASFRGKTYLSLVLLTAKILRRSRWLRRLFAYAESRLFQSNSHQELFRKYHPSLLVIADNGTIALSNLLMGEAKRHGTEIVSIVLSWDNLTSKGMGGTMPDYAVAWNENMKEELQEYHAVEPSRIFLGGVAHFDDYFRNGATAGKEEFLRTFDLAPNRRTIFLGTASPSTFRHNVALIRLLLEAIDKGAFVEPCQLLVRFHPASLSKMRGALGKEKEQIDGLKERYGKLLALDFPETIPQKYGDVFSTKDQHKLAMILQHSDVMVNLFSTLMLEACIFDLPVINVGFYNYGDTNFNNKMLKDFTHIRKIVDYGAVRIAYSEQELFDLTNMYLKDRSMDRTERRLVREKEGGPNKGRAGEAIADYLYGLWQEASVSGGR